MRPQLDCRRRLASCTTDTSTTDASSLGTDAGHVTANADAGTAHASSLGADADPISAGDNTSATNAD